MNIYENILQSNYPVNFLQISIALQYLTLPQKRLHVAALVVVCCFYSKLSPSNMEMCLNVMKLLITESKIYYYGNIWYQMYLFY